MFNSLSRRSWLSTLSFASFLSAAPSPSRKVLAKHRNLFNGDSCTYFYNPELWQPEGGPYSARAIHRYVDLLADSGIDTFLINPNAQVPWYPSKNLQTVLDGYKRGDREFFRGHAIAVNTPPDQMDAYLDHMMKFFNLYQDLIDAHVDRLAETSVPCRAPWRAPLGVRSDERYARFRESEGQPFQLCFVQRGKISVEGAAARSPRDVPPLLGRAQLRTSGSARFHDELIREYLEVYDFEGMELDWLRNPQCCEPPAGAAQHDLMTVWIADVRRQTEARARRLAKPVPLRLRIPGSLGYMKSIGLDVPRLACGIDRLHRFQQFLADLLGDAPRRTPAAGWA